MLKINHLYQLKTLFLSLSLLFIGLGMTGQETNFTNPQGIEFVLIKPGSMIVGNFNPPVNKEGILDLGGGRVIKLSDQPGRISAPKSDYILAEQLAKESARPGFKVNIRKPYYIGKYEITQGQWKMIMGSNPSYFKEGKVSDNVELHPVESVSWQDVQAFIQKLNELDKAHTYRLPTEFEWEYAARGGASDDISWEEVRNTAVIGTTSTSQIGSKKPNAWGLYDILGNVWEWVQDYYNEKIFADTVPPDHGKEHVLKGAPFYGDVKNATYMTHAGGPGSKYDVGFRLVMEIR
jgi:formylglycine-generating enzyme